MSNKFIGGIKEFLTINLLLLVIVLSILTVILTLSYIKKVEEQRKIKEIERSEKILVDILSHVKTWDTTSNLLYLGIKKVKLITKYSEGKMYYILTLTGLDANNKIFSNNSDDAKFTLIFLDKDKFKIYSIDLYLKNGSYLIDKNDISKEQYLRFCHYNMGWNF